MKILISHLCVCEIPLRQTHNILRLTDPDRGIPGLLEGRNKIKEFAPSTDPNNFGPVSGNTTFIFLALIATV